jgi:hypothetical protein
MFADQSRKHLREFPEMAIMLTAREPVLSNSRDHHPAPGSEPAADPSTRHARIRPNRASLGAEDTQDFE